MKEEGGLTIDNYIGNLRQKCLRIRPALVNGDPLVPTGRN